jgi:hypothetical protein
MSEKESDEVDEFTAMMEQSKPMGLDEFESCPSAVELNISKTSFTKTVGNEAVSTISLSTLGSLHEVEKKDFQRSINESAHMIEVEDEDVEIVDFDMMSIESVDNASSPREVAYNMKNKRLLLDMRSNDPKIRFLAHYEANYGILTVALSASGVTRKNYEKYRERDAEFKEAVNNMTEVKLDVAELSMFAAMERGNANMADKYLSKMGQSRGYGNPNMVIKKLLGHIAMLEGSNVGEMTAAEAEKNWKEMLKT